MPHGLESMKPPEVVHLVITYDASGMISAYRNGQAYGNAYQKPPAYYIITEETPLKNPFWDYSQNKIACEQDLMQAYKENGFPATIVRPSLTYGPSQLPLCTNSWQHPYTIIDRMKKLIFSSKKILY